MRCAGHGRSHQATSKVRRTIQAQLQWSWQSVVRSVLWENLCTDFTSEVVDVLEIRRCVVPSVRDLKQTLCNQQVGNGHFFRLLRGYSSALKMRIGDLRYRIPKRLVLVRMGECISEIPAEFVKLFPLIFSDEAKTARTIDCEPKTLVHIELLCGAKPISQSLSRRHGWRLSIGLMLYRVIVDERKLKQAFQQVVGKCNGGLRQSEN